MANPCEKAHEFSTIPEVFGPENLPKTSIFRATIPAIVADSHPDAAEHFAEFFVATIRNPNTRSAYIHAIADFLRWQGIEGLHSLHDIRPMHVAAYIEQAGERVATQTVKQRLAAVKGMFDWLVRKGVMSSNPAQSVRGPSYETARGKTPILSAKEAKQLLDSIPGTSVVDLRDKALIALMTYSFARISAAISMNVEDIIQTAGRSWVRLHEKRGKLHELPIHHKLLDHLDAYMAAGQLTASLKSPLFQSAKGRGGQLSGNRLSRHDAYAMIRRRAAAAGITARIGNHSFRGTGITAFLQNDGSLEMAQEMANHASPKTTKLYDRRNDQITQDAIERIRIE